MNEIPEQRPTQECDAPRIAGDELIARVRAEMGPEPLEIIFKIGSAIPEDYRAWPPARMVQFIRCRLGLTQHELASKAGLAPSQLSRLEGGKDCLLSTWARVYAALGMNFCVLPLTGLTIAELERRAAEVRSPYARAPSLRPHGPWFRKR